MTDCKFIRVRLWQNTPAEFEVLRCKTHDCLARDYVCEVVNREPK